MSADTHVHWLCFPQVEWLTDPAFADERPPTGSVECCECSGHDCQNAKTEMDRHIEAWRKGVLGGR